MSEEALRYLKDKYKSPSPKLEIMCITAPCGDIDLDFKPRSTQPLDPNRKRQYKPFSDAFGFNGGLGSGISVMLIGGGLGLLIGGFIGYKKMNPKLLGVVLGGVGGAVLLPISIIGVVRGGDYAYTQVKNIGKV